MVVSLRVSVSSMWVLSLRLLVVVSSKASLPVVSSVVFVLSVLSFVILRVSTLPNLSVSALFSSSRLPLSVWWLSALSFVLAVCSPVFVTRLVRSLSSRFTSLSILIVSNGSNSFSADCSKA